MSNTKRMDQIKLILKTYQRTKSKRATARTCQVSQNTVRHYLKLFESQNKPLSYCIGLSDEELRELESTKTSLSSKDERKQVFDLHVPLRIQK